MRQPPPIRVRALLPKERRPDGKLPRKCFADWCPREATHQAVAPMRAEWLTCLWDAEQGERPE
jgi:hypothetical protein